MRVPPVLLSLTDQGVIDEVVRPLKSGKEAQVYLVRASGELRVAKVYKDSDERSFKQRALYTEGRKVRNTRDQRAIDRRTRHGKAQEEGQWKTAEMDIIYRLHAAGVRVPTPETFLDGVLIMELVRGADGEPAPRLGELPIGPEKARDYYERLVREVVKMLCAGVVHSDLSEYNVLVDAKGPVIIDFPQSVDAAKNRNAKRLLLRDVKNLGGFLRRCDPRARVPRYGDEIWDAYERSTLTPDMPLTGRFKRSSVPADLRGLLDEIEFAAIEEAQRRDREAGITYNRRGRRKREVIVDARGGSSGTKPATKPGSKPKPARGGGPGAGSPEGEGAPRRRRRRRGGSGGAAQPGQPSPGRASSPQETARGRGGPSPQDAQGSEGAPKKRRRRRRRKPDGEGAPPPNGRPDQASKARPSDPASARNTNPGPRGAAESKPASGGAEGAPKKRRRRRRRRRSGDATSAGERSE